MRSMLIDAGPIIALFDRSDRYHETIVTFLKTEPCQLVSTWPAVTEASHMLDFDNNAQLSMLEWIKRGGMAMYAIESKDVQKMIDLIRKYNDLPMDLADASLVVAAETLGIGEILTIDTDFYVYRTIEKQMIRNVLQQNPEG